MVVGSRDAPQARPITVAAAADYAVGVLLRHSAAGALVAQITAGVAPFSKLLGAAAGLSAIRGLDRHLAKGQRGDAVDPAQQP
jgi:hypothetical protein